MKKILTTCLLAAAAVAANGAAKFEAVDYSDGAETFENPGRGWVSAGWRRLSPGRVKTQGDDVAGNATRMWALYKYSKGNRFGDEKRWLERTAPRVGGADVPLDADALAAISNTFAKCRASGGAMIPRFAYDPDGMRGAEPEDFEIVLLHIRQLGGIVSAFVDSTPAVECGIIGPYGEMHSSKYCAPEYANRIIDEWLAATPANVKLLVRTPRYLIEWSGLPKKDILAGRPTGKGGRDVSRIGFYNDGYLGTDGDYGTWGWNSRNHFDRDEAMRYLTLRGDLPYGGEFATVSPEFLDEHAHLFDPSRHNLVREWYMTRLSYCRSVRHRSMTVVKRLEALPFSGEVYKFDGMPSLAEYEGVDLRKFCEDHMGYRFVVRGVELKPGAVAVEVENTGFGRLLLPASAELVVSAPGTGKSATVAAPQVRLGDVEPGRRAEFEIPLKLPAGAAAKPFALALRVRTASGAAIRFANKGCWDEAAQANRLGK